jgi:hypothetical protein
MIVGRRWSRTNVQGVSIRLTEMAQHRKYGKKGIKLSNLPCINVLMLNPKVGLILVISSPLSFLRIVVFPALSRPLLKIWQFGNVRELVSLQKKQTHFFFFLSIFANDRK